METACPPPAGPAACSRACRHYTPKEFAGELAQHGITYTERWVVMEIRAGRIATNPNFHGRHLIPESELERVLRGEVKA